MIRDETSSSIDFLKKVMKALRDPVSGCAWDLEQDFASLTRYAIEEAYEVADAVIRDDMNDFKEELGDLLLQVIFQSQMAEEKDLFDFEDVAQTVADKMISRHPHIFSDAIADTSDAVLLQWDQIKAKEKPLQDYLLSDIPSSFPSILRAYKLQSKAAKVGFDWPEICQVFDKVEEEIVELKQEVEDRSSKKISEEYGDLLFTIVNLGRKLGIDPETALNQCNNKFISRFNGMEDEAKSMGQNLADMSLVEMEKMWVRQKALTFV